MEQADFLTKKLATYGEAIFDFMPKLLGGLLILWIGLKIIKKIHNFATKILNVNSELKPFLLSLIDIGLKIFLFLTVAGIIGFNTSSLMALVAAMGFAIGMALQGSLGNFASGVLLLIFKPYKVGDVVEIDGHTGEVTEIQIFNTLITTPDGRHVIIPNSKASGDTIVNHSTDGSIRVDVFTYIPYEEDFERVEQLLKKDLASHPKILHDQPNAIDIEAYESHSIKIGIFYYCQPQDYWSVYYDINRTIKKTFGQNGIKVAYSEGVELGSIGKN